MFSVPTQKVLLSKGHLEQQQTCSIQMTSVSMSTPTQLWYQQKMHNSFKTQIILAEYISC